MWMQELSFVTKIWFNVYESREKGHPHFSAPIYVLYECVSTETWKSYLTINLLITSSIGMPVYSKAHHIYSYAPNGFNTHLKICFQCYRVGIPNTNTFVIFHNCFVNNSLICTDFSRQNFYMWWLSDMLG